MVQVDLITGFLGSGKTTFLRRYVQYLVAQGHSVCILENDFGAVNVDAMLLQDLIGEHCDIETISGGCDCDTHQRRMRTKLISMAMRGFDRVVIEPSGIFDVDEFYDILRDEPLDRWYTLGSVIAIVDAKLENELSPQADYLLASEAASAGLVVMSRTQLAAPGEAEAVIDHLNRAPEADGILVQLPLPEPLEEAAVIEAIAPEKDVDCFHPYNVGRLQAGSPVFLPCTPAGVMEMLREYGISPAGKRCVVLGRSNIVGKPMALMLLERNATVTIAHSRTKDLPAVCREADLLVVAVGRAKLVTADYVKEGAVVIDVGMDRDENGKLCGDVNTESVLEKASYVTPVPGGVGPMTIAMLLTNTVSAALGKFGKSLN